ncbi:YxeA family protein [Enterococcus sp. BWR-S5]|uniref:YxeA family protein n=1 Tax=Enterococcus sp. BWR-S5 TaxID=2787714 RepID=UPI0019212045|nr:YxeA family protein [Enterococcus sp. BWR-S5]MBL1227403.1 YxeA family protein [Enterococcus sp. BWR-S5]
MKKMIALLVGFLLLSGGAWYAYDYYYGGNDYYTEITATGDVSQETDSKGQSFTVYHYTQVAFDKDGKETTQKMNESRDKPLRIGAFLKLKVNERKGIISWEEVKQNEVPDKALEKINAASTNE